MRCYLVKDKRMGSVVYEYWADAPLVWVDTHYPWADTAEYETVEAPVQPERGPTLDTVEGLSWSVFDFMRKFDIQEHAAIVSSTDPLVKAFHDRLIITAAQNRRVYASDPDTQGAMTYMVSLGMFAADRAAEILA